MSCTIISDIIEHSPEVIQNGHLVLRSDNCSTQYKSRYVFQGLIDLTKKNKIQITWFFGEAGHGRGLIDAMAWFSILSLGVCQHTWHSQQTFKKTFNKLRRHSGLEF